MTSKIKQDKLKSKTHSQDSIPSFIRKTYDILEERKFPEVIDWNPEGTALVIKKPSEFCQKVLPAYFKHNNLTSFVRQLNMYNFHKRRTQNIDHVYYHELFQRGKKHLLKEIKRKNHDHASDKAQKALEIMEPSQTGKDFNSLMYENQFLKRLYNDAMSKVSALEGQIKELTVQNQSLWAQASQQNENETSMKPIIRYEKPSELTQDQLPMTFGDISIPPLKLNSERQMSISANIPFAKTPSMNVSCFFSTVATDESGESTEVSHNSPSLQPTMESEKNFDMSEAASQYIESNGQTFQLPTISLTPQISQIQLKPNELFINRQEMSVGQLFEAWNYEAQNGEMGNFPGQKIDKATINPQAFFQEPSVLGKRQFEGENQGNLDPKFLVPEPLMKRHELCVFNRKGLLSTGTEDKEILRTVLRRESSVNEEYDPNMGVDLMDFNQPFCGWTKAA